MQKRKIIIWISTMFVLSMAVYGIWTIFAGSSFTGMVTSSGGEIPLEFTVDLDNVSIDATNADTLNNITSILTNNDGNLNTIFNATITKTDVSDSCVDYENDCTVSFLVWTQAGGVVSIDPGDPVLLESGDHPFITQIQCLRHSCPQDIDVAVSFTGQ